MAASLHDGEPVHHAPLAATVLAWSASARHRAAETRRRSRQEAGRAPQIRQRQRQLRRMVAGEVLAMDKRTLAPPDPMSGPRRTVLVVDDDDAVRESLAELMALDGHTVLSASDGEEALEVLRHQRVHVVLLDVVMPRLDGLSLLAGLDCPPPAVILHSALDDADRTHARASIASKTFSSIRKPAPPEQLLAAVAEAAGPYSPPTG